jgi:large subunit ribosomal protein L32e
MAEGEKKAGGAKPSDKAGVAAQAKRAKAEERAALEAEAKAAAAEDTEEEEDAREGDEAPAPKAKPSKAAPKGEGDEGASTEKKAKGKSRPKPKIDAALKAALATRTRKSAQRQAFHRQEWFRYQRLGTKWRAPGGIQSKMRRHWGTHADVVSIGYRGPKAARGLHPSGFKEVLVHNPDGLKAVDPAREAVRIASSVGWQKREAIQKDARKRGIRVLNWKVREE